MAIGFLDDARYMLASIDVAISGVEKHGPQYGAQVGSVLVGKDGKIISSAHNTIYGGSRRHAEEIVLAKANGTDLSDATLYLTMEPCNGNPHHKRKHCCEQIVDAGIGRVVIGNLKYVYVGGADYMEEQGVRVDHLEDHGLQELCNLLTSNSANGNPLSDKVVDKIQQRRTDMSELFWVQELQQG